MKAALAAGLALLAAPAEAACRLALAFALDVSESVDAREYRLQLDGLAAALEDEAVSEALLARPESPVALAAYEWSGPEAQRGLLPWTRITDAAALAAVAARLRATERALAPGPTAIGAALAHGARLMAEGPVCWRQVIDISGDGKSNTGPAPGMIRRALGRITVNALVVGSDGGDWVDRRQMQIGELSSYFRVEVIRGPEAFVETALGYEDFRRAMTRKLLRELETRTVARQ
ncbi:hypothetical protein DRV85_04150 [Rhodosalinus halophilus]|uniref:VWFA domain-containing protein n=1 Tax=Rhodosalinus halophilus TaxID=2259333 RepID=A0A365UBE0_9RHOB|nr:DUF1194 domain-containing protein [Rhodosalinus halophilus]RBI86630.1 hypothetical protein DRV85_04150 [Rhodosalinus halophilus]